MLWIALHLPLLSLESFAATLAPGARVAASEPLLALVDARHITHANAAAQALGIGPGMQRATALALAPGITLGAANPTRDGEALTAVAHAALAFTPMVAVQPAHDAVGAARQAPDTVLLEVQGSLRYFGGRALLLQRLHAALAPLGHRLHTVSAPTPLAAALLARVHRAWHGDDLAATAQALHAAPVWLLGPGRLHWEALQGMGLRTLADLRTLPRSGLARRFGPALLDELDRALGTRPDPRVPLQLPPRFDARLELFHRADTTEQLLYGAGVLLARLVAWLAAQHAFARRFTLVMEHEPRSRSDTTTPAETALDIALAEPSRDTAHLLVLLRERLANLPLPAPTLELRLHCDDIAQRAPPSGELFPTARSEQEGLTRLIERLQARLGAAQVQRLVSVADHRPERATCVQPADARVLLPARPQAATQRAASPGHAPTHAPAHAPAHAPSMRPVWLLEHAEPLIDRATGPQLDGQPLQLVSGPERIEAGWWDAGLAERDYFIAQLPCGALVWVYRARRLADASGPGWFLQGRFG